MSDQTTKRSPSIGALLPDEGSENFIDKRVEVRDDATIKVTETIFDIRDMTDAEKELLKRIVLSKAKEIVTGGPAQVMEKIIASIRSMRSVQ